MKDLSDLIYSPSQRQWKRIGFSHHHGIAVPLFSIHSKDSTGIGEYPDLILLIDWCQSVGFDVIQLLPINDTGNDTSPYNAISAFALNPLFIGLNALPYLNESKDLQEKLKIIPKYPNAANVDYPKVRENKYRFLRDYFRTFGETIISSDDFKKFFERATHWLVPFCVFNILSHKNDLKSWENWPEEEKNPTQPFIDQISNEKKEEFDWYCVLQYLCDAQLKKAKAYAEEKGVFLKGDIPILISRNSADVWFNKELFDLNYSAGAPPDYYSELGQNWGFPIYRWEAIESRNYDWWIERLQWASQYYDMYRLDHIVGFFRIWAIPLGKTGKEGFFIPKDETLWIDHGLKILLMMISSCDMLPIGEDLGAVPPDVKLCLNALGICGTRVMRWERNWKGDQQYILPQNYDIESMTTLSTHDSETTLQWWKNNPEETKLFAEAKGWTHHPQLSREHLKEILWDCHHSSSLFHINLLQEYLPLLPGISWPNVDDERINFPGTLNEKNWSYRFKISLEELAEQESLKNIIQEILK